MSRAHFVNYRVSADHCSNDDNDSILNNYSTLKSRRATFQYRKSLVVAWKTPDFEAAAPVLGFIYLPTLVNRKFDVLKCFYCGLTVYYRTVRDVAHLHTMHLRWRGTCLFALAALQIPLEAENVLHHTNLELRRTASLYAREETEKNNAELGRSHRLDHVLSFVASVLNAVPNGYWFMRFPYTISSALYDLDKMFIESILIRDVIDVIEDRLLRGVVSLYSESSILQTIAMCNPQRCTHRCHTCSFPIRTIMVYTCGHTARCIHCCPFPKKTCPYCGLDIDSITIA